MPPVELRLALYASSACMLMATAASHPVSVEGSVSRAVDPSARGPFEVTTSHIAYEFDGRTAPIDLYYPASGPPAPPVLILPSGLTGGPENHVGHGEHLASWGYAAAVVHQVPFADGVDAFENADRASAALDAVISAPELAGRLVDRAAIVGTHYNGMSAINAAVRDERFRAVVGLHPAMFPYGSEAELLTVPTLVLGGNIEGGILCTYGTTWKVLYNATGSPHKAEFLFPYARPSDFQDPPWDGENNLCGEPRSEPFPWIPGLMTAWLEYYIRGDTDYYHVLYGARGSPSLPREVSDSIADNAPQLLDATTQGSDSAILTWRSPYTDTAALAGFVLSISRGGGTFGAAAELPLGSTSFLATGLEPGIEYRFSLAYRDRVGREFQSAGPVAIVGGAATPTPSHTARPTSSPFPTPTSSPTSTDLPLPSPSPSPTATDVIQRSTVYLPKLSVP